MTPFTSRAGLLAGLCALAAGCAQLDLDVKKRWNESLRSYSLAPLYPMREDVYVGDVRIHRIKKPAYALDSRLLGHLTPDPKASAKDDATAETVKAGGQSQPTTLGAKPPAKLGARPDFRFAATLRR